MGVNEWGDPEPKTGREPLSDGARHREGVVPGDAFLGLGIVLILALTIPEFIDAFKVLGGAEPTQADLTGAGLWVSAIALLLVFGGLPFAWVATTRRGGWAGTIEFLRLEHPQRLGWGVGLGFAILIVISLLALLAQQFVTIPDNPAIPGLGLALTWPLAVALSISAGVGEEILFRGALQRHIGIFGQAAVFGLLHAYQGIMGILLTMALALVFGYIVKRGWGLWTAIGAHVTFNMVQFAAIMVSR